MGGRRRRGGGGFSWGKIRQSDQAFSSAACCQCDDLFEGVELARGGWDRVSRGYLCFIVRKNVLDLCFPAFHYRRTVAFLRSVCHQAVARVKDEETMSVVDSVAFYCGGNDFSSLAKKSPA